MPKIVLTPRVRRAGGRRRTIQIWYASPPTASAKNTGCKRWSQIRHALRNENMPSPARTGVITHQLGVRRAAMIDTIPARLGSIAISNLRAYLSSAFDGPTINCSGGLLTPLLRLVHVKPALR